MDHPFFDAPAKLGKKIAAFKAGFPNLTAHQRQLHEVYTD